MSTTIRVLLDNAGRPARRLLLTLTREGCSNRYLHQIFPNGGPQKQGNRLAGLLRTKGEH